MTPLKKYVQYNHLMLRISQTWKSKMDTINTTLNTYQVQNVYSIMIIVYV